MIIRTLKILVVGISTLWALHDALFPLKGYSKHKQLRMKPNSLAHTVRFGFGFIFRGGDAGWSSSAYKLRPETVPRS